MNRTLFCAVALVVTAPVAVAQDSLAVEDQIAVRLHPSSVGTFVTSTVARLGDDPAPDCLVVRQQNGRLDACYMPGPAECTMLVTVAADIRDACVLVGAGPDGRDAVLVLDDSGLRWFECGEGAQMPAERLDLFDDSWASCDRIWALRNEGSVAWLFGASDTEPEIRRRKVSGTWGTDDVLPVPAGATQIETLDWDGAGDHEIVVRYGALVYLLRWDGEVLDGWQFPTPPPGGHSLLSVIPASGGERDLLAMFGFMPGGSGGPAAGYYLLVQRQGIAWMLGYGANAAASMAAADMNGDGLVDLVLGDASGAFVRVVNRVGTGGAVVPPVSLGPTHALVAGPDRPSGSVDTLAATDFDGDGDADLVGLQSTNGLGYFVAGGAVPHRRLPDVFVTPNSMTQTGTTVNLGLQGTLPEGWSSVLGMNESAVVDVRIWQQASGAGFIEQVARVGNHTVSIGGQDMEFSTPIHFDSGTVSAASAMYWIYARIVVTGPNGTRRLPATLLHFTADPGLQAQRVLQVHADETGSEEGEGGDRGGDGNTLGGGLTGRDPGEPPVIGGGPG